MNADDHIFHAETDSGHIYKVFIEMVSGFGFRRCALVLSKHGMFLTEMDPERKYLFDAKFESSKFKYFKYEFEEEEVVLDLGIVPFKKLVGTAKKKDCIIFFIKKPIDNAQISSLSFIIKPKNSGEGLQRSDENDLAVSRCKKSLIDFPPESYDKDGVSCPVYNEPVVLNTSDMQKLKKPSSTASTKSGVVLTIQPKTFISFSGTDDINLNKLCFGKYNSEKPKYERTFENTTIAQISKAAGFGGLTRFFAPPLDNIDASSYPAKVVADMGTIGVFCVFIKDKEQIDREAVEIQRKANDVIEGPVKKKRPARKNLKR